MPNTFPKNSKLCGQERIAQLYKNSKHFVAWPLRVTWEQLPNTDETPNPQTQVLVWAPKSLFKHAVQRNHLRRLMREAYRLHQDLLGENKYLIAFNYIDKGEQSFATIEKAICKALNKIANQ